MPRHPRRPGFTIPQGRRRRALLAVGLCYAIYFGLIAYCEVSRPEDLGMKLEYARGRISVVDVLPESPAGVGGLKAGDRITQLGPIDLRSRVDRFQFHPRLQFTEPIPITWLRGDVEMHSTIAVSLGDPAFWKTRAGVTLALMRAVQLAMLALALVIAWKQPQDLGACVGAWLLATLAVYSIVLPARLPAVWRDLPAPVELALWVPYLSQVSAGAILATFYTVFPQRAPRWKLILGIIWGLTLPLLAISAYDQLQVMYAPHEVPLPASLTWLNIPATLLFVALGAAVMVRNYRRLSSETERRRVRVVLASSCIACLSAGAAVTYWASSARADLTTGLFSSWVLTLGILPTILVPFSFAYAISRHRLFDISLILRRGLQYALARRFLLSLIPAVALLLVLDLYLQPQTPAGGLHRGRLWWYAALLTAAVWIYRRRADWLEALDRRYFRERYSAQKLLRDLAEDLQKTTRLEDVLPNVASRIEAALHPKYVALLVRSHDGRFYEPVNRSNPAPQPVRFSAGDKSIRLLAVLGRPLVVGADAPHSVFDQLPEDERRALLEHEIELLVAVPGPGDTVEALLALGMKRSEEPYSSEDLDLLTAVALNLKTVLPASATTEECDTCGTSYTTGTGRCTSDGTVLVRSETPPVLADRYTIERRLGRGGMGTVYAARDLQLRRRVAVKLLRDRLESAPSVERCRREARAAAALAHPNVVTIYDMGLTSDGRPFLVLELLRGSTLREALSSGPLSLDSIPRVFEGVCAALEAAHGHGLVHRDLKPENVFLVNGAREASCVKLLDFGISTFVDDDGTRSGALLGTPEYASPEQIRGDVPRASWDVWALSVMAFEAAVGVRPVACVPMALAGRVSTQEFTWSGPALARLRPPLADFFGRALSLDPAERPKTPGEFFDGLQRALI